MGTWDYDLVGNVCHFDERARKLYNLSSGSLDHRPEGITAVVHPDDVGPMFDEIRKASDVDGDGRYEIDYRIAQTDGSYRWLRAWGKAKFEGEGPARRAVRIVGATRDVTNEKTARALRESEERLRAFGEASQDVLWIRDAETLQWEYLTPAFETIYGVSRERALAGDNLAQWANLIVPEDRAHATSQIVRVRDGERVSFEFRIKRPSDGEIRWLRDTDFPIRDPNGKVVGIGGIGHDITKDRRAADRQEMLTAELQHRVRNILANIRSIIGRTAGNGAAISEFRDHLEGRLAALARTQSVLTRSPGEGVDLEVLVREELLAQAADEKQFTVSDSRVRLASKAAEAVTLAIHELATNAVKYGALVQPSGRIDIAWRTEPRNGVTWLVLDWIERGVSIAPDRASRQGFGTELITRRIPYELRGTGTMDLRTDGLHAEIAFPVEGAVDSLSARDDGKART